MRAVTSGNAVVKGVFLPILLVVAALLGGESLADAQKTPGEVAGMRASFGQLLELRASLLKRFAGRTSEDGSEILRLKIEEGADQSDLELVLRRAAGKWRPAEASVPDWDQSGINEYRRYFWGGRNFGAWVPRARPAIDPSGLKFEGGRLSGDLGAVFRLDRTLADKTASTPTPDVWSKFEPRTFLQERPQKYKLDVRTDPGRVALSLALHNAVKWPPSKPGEKTPGWRTVLVRTEAPGTRFTPVEVRVPNFNSGAHEGFAGGLKWENGRLTGDIEVHLHTDSWYPTTGYDRKPPMANTFTVDATVENHIVKGTYRTRGVLGEWEGEVSGTAGQALVGEYRCGGSLPEQAGIVRGILFNDLAPAERYLSKPPAVPADDGEAVKVIAAAADDVVADIKALHMALQKHPMPLFVARTQVEVARAVWPAEDKRTGAVMEYLAAAVETLGKATEPDAAMPVGVPEKGGISPGSGTTAMETGANGVCALPLKADGWFHIPKWRCIGPFDHPVGLELPDAFVPELVPATGVVMRQLFDRGATPKSEKDVRTWVEVNAGFSLTYKPPVKMKSGFGGFIYYGVARVAAAQKSRAWLALESKEGAKVWLNGGLVWSDRGGPFRVRPRERTIVPVELAEGLNTFLVRLDHDRGDHPFLNLALTAKDPGADTDMPKARPCKIDTPAPVDPPLAWDIDKGINVLWRDEKLAGDRPPLAVGGKVYAAESRNILHCLDAKTGSRQWSMTVEDLPLLGIADASVLTNRDRNVAAETAGKLGVGNNTSVAGLAAGSPVACGGKIVFGLGSGFACAFDASGKELWKVRTGVLNPVLRANGAVVVVQGLAAEGFPANATPAGKAGGARTSVVVLDAKDGRETGRWCSDGLTYNGVFLQPRSSDDVVYAFNGVQLLSLPDARPLLRLEAELPRAWSVCASPDILFHAGIDRCTATLIYRQPDGRLAWRTLWEGNEDARSFEPSLSCFHGGYVWSYHHAVDHGPHCPSSASTLSAYEAGTARLAGRVKPVLKRGRGGYNVPVPAGKYVAFSSGSGDGLGGDMSHGHMSFLAADGSFLAVQPDVLIDVHATMPVFMDNLLFMRSRSRGLVCIGVKGEEGKRFQTADLAGKMLKAIGQPPMKSQARKIEPLADPVLAADVPVAVLGELPSTFWLGAGPFPPGGDEGNLASLRARTGTDLTLNGKTLKMQTVPLACASNDSPTFVGIYSLQGTGQQVPVFDAHLDPRCHSGTNGTGVFYGELQNTIARTVRPDWYADPMRGITVWLNGQRIEKDAAYALAPGRYSMVLRIDPPYYDRSVPVDETPVDVAKAVAGGVLEDIGWPKQWRVLGPLRLDFRPLTKQELSVMPGATWKSGDEELRVHEAPVHGEKVGLTALLVAVQGSEPDWDKAPEETDVAVPSKAYCFAEIEAPRDGLLCINAGADWYMRWYLDGVPFYDTTEIGNSANWRDPTKHPFEARVGKGRHVLAVMVVSGSRGFALLSRGGFTDKSKESLQPYAVQRGARMAEDWRLRPCFDLLTDPAWIAERFQKRMKLGEPVLREAVEFAPQTPEGRAAAALLGVTR